LIQAVSGQRRKSIVIPWTCQRPICPPDAAQTHVDADLTLDRDRVPIYPL